ncbi:hypothetical protein D9756_003855 [Leucocoprinus leucothites]|uniref:Uncharacterized protein n=1 Tax=Leucocoprinus leucothites TaxID=201217 RepID=A0A8H5DAP5_9AGAR|nr:hypothetical protein D9756_003855 [Leucoagaricus leucothites]
MGNSQIRIWYRESSKYSASLAKKLIMQHAIEDLRVPLAASPFKHERKQISHQDPLPTYAFYPFFCEHTCASEEKSGFRLRRVGKWFGEESRLVSHVNSGDSTHDFIAIVGNHADAREQLLAQAGTFDRGQALSITATPGHVVLSSRGSSAFTLAPPLEGQKNFSEIMDWVREQSPSTEFILSAPVLFWQAPDYDQPWRRRLVYETTPAPTGRTQILICEYTPEHSKGVPAEVEGDPIKIKNTSTPVLRGGSVTRLDVLMPDDTRDLRLTLTYDNELAEASWPHELSKLVGNKTPSPMSDAPLVLEHENQQYILKEDTFFQSSISSVESEAIPVNVTSERRFDHQSSESYLTYEINCSDLFSDVAWKTFWSRCEKATQDKSAPLLDEVHYQELQ